MVGIYLPVSKKDKNKTKERKTNKEPKNNKEKNEILPTKMFKTV